MRVMLHCGITSAYFSFLRREWFMLHCGRSFLRLNVVYSKKSNKCDFVSLFLCWCGWFFNWINNVFRANRPATTARTSTPQCSEWDQWSPITLSVLMYTFWPRSITLGPGVAVNLTPINSTFIWSSSRRAIPCQSLWNTFRGEKERCNEAQ